MTRLTLALVSLVFFFWLGMTGSSALKTPGTYAEFRSSDSVSGQLTVGTFPSPYELPEHCGPISNYQIVDMTLLGIHTYTGGSGNEAIFGTEQADVIFGGSGDDCILAGGGDDWVVATIGEDWIFGGDGDDVLLTDSNGHIDGGPGNDLCSPRSVSVNCGQSSVENLELDGHHSIPTIDVQWDPIPFAAYYAVYRSESATGPFALIGTSYDPSYSDVGVGEDATYYYQVTAIFDGGSQGEVESDPTEPESAMVPSATTTVTPTTITGESSTSGGSSGSPTPQTTEPTATPAPTETPSPAPTEPPTDTPVPVEPPGELP